MRKEKDETKGAREVTFHYDQDTDMMYVTRVPHRFSSDCLELGNNMRVMVDKDIKDVLGLVFLNYYEFIPQFFKNRTFEGRKCGNCKSQQECFARNIQTLLESEIELKRVKRGKAKIPNVESDLRRKIRRLPEKAFACV